jgi:hypothetical protein
MNNFKKGDKAVIPVEIVYTINNHSCVVFPNGDTLYTTQENLMPCVDAVPDPIQTQIDYAAKAVGITDEERPTYEKLVYDYINLKQFTYQEAINAALREIVLTIKH